MKVKNVALLKKNLYFLNQISNNHIYINLNKNEGKIHFFNINDERTIIADFTMKYPKRISEDISIRSDKTFYDIFSRIENGSEVTLNFKKDKILTRINYEDIEFDGILSANPSNFQGLPKYTLDYVFKISGDKLYHGFNLLARLKSDLKLKIQDGKLIIKTENTKEHLKLILPPDMKINQKKVKESIYDYEIIKHLLRAARISKKADIGLSWNKNIEDNILVVKFHFKKFNGGIEYLFTPKG